jgi:cytochrome oxidase Cu insertion factor (SCO1/SenC/PrrC family)
MFWQRLLFLLFVMPLAALVSACTTQDGVSVGAPAPGFSLPDAADSQSVSLSDYSGQPVLLYFHMAVG